MEEAYAVLYKKEIINEDECSFLFKPCYVIKGLYDVEEDVFLDEINKVRYAYYDPRIMTDNIDYVVGQHYTLSDLMQTFPDASNEEEIKMELFKDAEGDISIGKYDEEKGYIEIGRYASDNGVEIEIEYENDDDPELSKEVINAIVTAFTNSDTDIIIEDELEFDQDDDEDGIEFYEQTRKQIGADYLVISLDEIKNIDLLNDFNQMKNYIDYIKDSKYKYQKKIRELGDPSKFMFVIENDLYSVLDNKNASDVIEYFKKALKGENSVRIEIPKVFDYDELINAIENCYNNVTNLELENVTEEIEKLYTVCQESFNICLDMRDEGKNIEKTLFYLNTQTINLLRILEYDDLERQRDEYINLYNVTKEDLLDLDEEHKSKRRPDSIEGVNAAIARAMSKLDSLIGLENVKESFDSIFSTLLFKKKTEENLSFESDSKHMVFTGNPGTGKTTVANIVAPLFYKLGYIDSPKVSFVAAQDLVGEYVGQTAPKTEEVIKKNKGGLIVLDEAYILAGHGNNDFGNEAMTVILKEMEKNRTMFIFAGYEKEMKEFIKMNSGIKSRVGTYLNFKDYSEEELCKMFEKTINDTACSDFQECKLRLTSDAKDKVKELIHEAVEIKDFGNGRFIKNLFNTIKKEHAKNTKYNYDIDRLYLITEEDVPEDTMQRIFFDDKNNDSLYKSTNMGFTKVKERKKL